MSKIVKKNTKCAKKNVILMFIPFFIFWSLWHGSEKVSCHFPAKCKFLCRKINKQDSWFFRFWFFWQESRGWGMEWTGQKTRNILIHILITVYKDSNNLQRSQTLQSLKPSLNWPITLLQMANRAGWASTCNSCWKIKWDKPNIITGV